MCIITYDPSTLKSMNNGQIVAPSTELQIRLNEIKKYAKPNRRGCRAGRNKQRHIQVISSVRNSQPQRKPASCGVNHSNLSQLQQAAPSPTNSNDQQQPETYLPTFMLFNAQSLNNKFEEAEVIFNQNQIDIGVVTESWFSTNIPENQLNIPNYNLHSKPRTGKGGGGVALYVKEDIPSTPFEDITVPPELECMWIKIRPKRLPRHISCIAVCVVYITTKSPHQDLLANHLMESVDYLRAKYPEIGLLILGDFNRMDISQIIRGNDLYQMVDFPTRGDATLDLMISSSKLKDHYLNPSPMSPIGYSDHVCVLWKPKGCTAKKNNLKSKITRPLSESGINSFGTWIQSVDWHTILQDKSTQEKANVFYDMLDQAMTTCFPEKKTRGHSNDKNWITPYIKTLIRKRQKAFASGNVHEWRTLRNKVKREVEKAKQSYYTSRIRNLQKVEPRKWHSEIKKVTKSCQAELKLDVPGVDDHDEKGKADAINSMFASVSDGIPPLDVSELPSFLPAQAPPPHLHPWEVYAELKKINPNKSGGPDMIPGRIIKEFAYELSTPLCDILNSSFAEGTVPTQWKKGIVVPVPKQSPPSVDKLRPISLTSIFAKIAEGFVSRWILEDIGHLIDKRQFGNVPGVSTSHYLTSLIHYVHQGAEKSHSVGTVVLTDFSKAFDLVNHNILIEKIIGLGVRGAIVPWICDFLHNRQQCVRFNRTLSDDRFLSAGVPQGTKLGPIGFQILINDAAEDAKVEYWKYVDDLTFAESKSRNKDGHLQNDLDDFVNWASQTGLKLNPKKCQALEVNFSNTPHNSDLRIGAEKLSCVDKAKVLGVWVQNDLKWQTQVDEMLKKANRRLFMLRSLKRFGFEQEELVLVYKCYVRPVVEYCDVVWHSGLTSKQSAALERIQKRACKTICGHNHYNSYGDALTQCSMTSLHERRQEHCLKFAQGLNNNTRTNHLLPPTRFQSHGRTLRNANNLSQLPAKTDRFKNSPIPFFISLLNSH